MNANKTTLIIAAILFILIVAGKTVFTSVPFFFNLIDAAILTGAFLIAYLNNPIAYSSLDEVKGVIKQPSIRRLYFFFTSMVTAMLVINLVLGHYDIYVPVITDVLILDFALAVKLIVKKYL